MDVQTILYAFITGAVSVIAFFLVRFYYLVEELRKDVKQLLINESARKVAIENIKDDIEDIRRTVHEHDGQLNRLRIDISKLTKS